MDDENREKKEASCDGVKERNNNNNNNKVISEKVDRRRRRISEKKLVRYKSDDELAFAFEGVKLRGGEKGNSTNLPQ